VRRYFYEAVQLKGQDVVAIGIVVEINKLFKIEAELKELGLDEAKRLEVRKDKSAPIVEGLKTRIEAAAKEALPRSALGKACKYALGRWTELIRFLEYGPLELSNNLAESSIRPIALGRKNWLHLGSERAGPKVAAILSVVENLSTALDFGARLSARDPTWTGRLSGPAGQRVDTRRLERSPRLSSATIPPAASPLQLHSTGLHCVEVQPSETNMELV
jgi:hypothetical protein